MTPDHTRLRQLAEAATPGRWAWTRTYSRKPGHPPHFELYAEGPTFPGPFGPMPTHPLNICKSDDEWQPNRADADFIASTGPDVVLALLDEIAALRAGQGTPTGDPR